MRPHQFSTRSVGHRQPLSSVSPSFHLLPCFLSRKQKSLSYSRVSFDLLFFFLVLLLSYCSSCFITGHNWTNWYDIRIRTRGALICRTYIDARHNRSNNRRTHGKVAPKNAKRLFFLLLFLLSLFLFGYLVIVLFLFRNKSSPFNNG